MVLESAGVAGTRVTTAELQAAAAAAAAHVSTSGTSVAAAAHLAAVGRVHLLHDETPEVHVRVDAKDQDERRQVVHAEQGRDGLRGGIKSHPTPLLCNGGIIRLCVLDRRYAGTA